jgi:hypothetical protein
LFVFVYVARVLSQSNGERIDNDFIKFIIGHFFFYLTGGYYAFSRVIEFSLHGNVGLGILFAPIVNFFRLFTGDVFISTVADFVKIDLTTRYQETNVFTLFGCLQYETNVFITICIVIFIASVTYYCYCSLVINKRTNFIPLVSFIYSTLIFGFFNCFYGTLSTWLMIFVLVVFTIFEDNKVNNYKVIDK